MSKISPMLLDAIADLHRQKLELERDLSMRELAVHDFATYIRYCWNVLEAGDYMQSWHTVELCDLLQLVYDRKILKLIVEMPPRHSKSTHVSNFFPGWHMGKSPELDIITATHTGKFSEKFGGNVRDLLNSEQHRSIFGDLKKHKGRDVFLSEVRYDSKKKTDFKVYGGGQYIARGVGGATTGEGADLLICDDVIKDWEVATSPRQLETIWEWYKSVATTRLSPDGAQIMMGTRWSTEDPIGRVLKLEGKVEDGGQWHVLHYAAISEIVEKFRGANEALWADRYDLPSLRQKEVTLGTAMFAALYQQDPLSAMGKTFKKEDFRYVRMSQFENVGSHERPALNKDDFVLGQFVDPAFSSSKTSDDVVVAIVGEHKITKDLYLFDIFADTVVPSVSIRTASMQLQRWIAQGWTVRFCCCEDVKGRNKRQSEYLDDMQDKLTDDRVPVEFVRHHPKGEKLERIKFELEPVISSHKFYFRDDLPDANILDKIEGQFMSFPVSGKVDIPDVLCMASREFRRMRMGEQEQYSKQVKVEEERYEDDQIL